jgi:hypothetical protein
MASAPYNPGRPTVARLVNANEQLYAIDSFRGEGRSYLINLKTGSCNCPQFTKRCAGTPGAVCKHIEEVRKQARFIKLLTTARSLSDSDLARLLTKYTEMGDFETAGAMRVVRAERKAQATRPPVGTSTKTFGPRTDAEAFGGAR